MMVRSPLRNRWTHFSSTRSKVDKAEFRFAQKRSKEILSLGDSVDDIPGELCCELADCFVTLRDLNSAIEYGREGYAYIKKTGDDYWQIVTALNLIYSLLKSNFDIFNKKYTEARGVYKELEKTPFIEDLIPVSYTEYWDFIKQRMIRKI